MIKSGVGRSPIISMRIYNFYIKLMIVENLKSQKSSQKSQIYKSYFIQKEVHIYNFRIENYIIYTSRSIDIGKRKFIG